MRINRNRLLSLGVTTFLAFAGGSAAHAGLLANINLNQELSENDALSGNSKTVTDTIFPFQDTATVTDEFGGSYSGSITANYSLTDNGSVATFNINCSGYITTNGYGVGERTNGGTTPMFYLTQPCLYTETFSCAGPSNAELTYDNPLLETNGFVSNSTKTYSGTMATGRFFLTEQWGLSNNQAVPTNQSGTDSISITFYATEPIPEPSSALLIGVPALALLARRRRVVRTSQLLVQNNE